MDIRHSDLTHILRPQIALQTESDTAEWESIFIEARISVAFVKLYAQIFVIEKLTKDNLPRLDRSVLTELSIQIWGDRLDILKLVKEPSPSPPSLANYTKTPTAIPLGNDNTTIPKVQNRLGRIYTNYKPHSYTVERSTIHLRIRIFPELHHQHLWRCLWCNGYRHRIWTLRYEFNSWTRLIAFHIALIPLGKVWIQLFSLQLWVNSRTD